MAKIAITTTELVWPGKYDEDGTRKEAPRVSLPIQVEKAGTGIKRIRDEARAQGCP